MAWNFCWTSKFKDDPLDNSWNSVSPNPTIGWNKGLDNNSLWQGAWNTPAYQTPGAHNIPKPGYGGVERQLRFYARILATPVGTSFSFNYSVDDGFIFYWNGAEQGYANIGNGSKTVSGLTPGVQGVFAIYAENTFTGGLSRYNLPCALQGGPNGWCDGTDAQNPFQMYLSNFSGVSFQTATQCGASGWSVQFGKVNIGGVWS